MTLKPGDQAPDFTLPDADGRPVRLADLLARGPVVVYFYPRDETSICTAEACSFRDAYDVFKSAGAEVVGVSSDGQVAHQAFASKFKLPFVLVSDTDGAVRKAFGVPKTLGLLVGRVTYVIDAKGVVRHVFNSQFQAKRHVAEALAALRRLSAPCCAAAVRAARARGSRVHR